MKKKISTDHIRKIFSILLMVVGLLFVGFLVFLYLTFSNSLSKTPKTDQSINLLSDFRLENFQNSIDRLEKRRGLPDPADDTSLPFSREVR